MRILPDSSIVPALMFHSIGLENHPWAFAYISEPVWSFQVKVCSLVNNKFTGVFWEDVYQHMAGKRILQGRSVLLTFDDGYLDNWVFAYPILKKYGMKGTIFISTDFVDPSSSPRPNLEDVWNGRAKTKDLQPVGFLNWSEIKIMQESGIIDFQSHGKTHTWYFTGPEIVDFHLPGKTPKYPWLFWNKRPDRKPFYLTEDQQNYLPWGYPVLQYGQSLGVRRFFPEQEFLDQVSAYASKQLESDFSSYTSIKSRLSTYCQKIAADNGVPGRYETDEELAARKVEELAESKGTLEKRLGEKINFICWPCGAYDNQVIELAKSLGYKAWTLGSKDSSTKRNKPGAVPESLKRIGSSNKISVKGYGQAVGGAYYQLLKIYSHQNSVLHSFFLKAYKLAELFKSQIIKK